MQWIKKNVFIGIIILSWYIVSELQIWSEYILPSPQKVFLAFLSELIDGNLLENTYISLLRIIFGFFIACILAFMFGIIAGMKKQIFEYFENIIEFLRNIPPISLIAILILWFGIGEEPKIIIIILASFFSIFINTTKGIYMVDKKLLEVGYSLNFTKIQLFFKIILPSSLPYILSGMKIGLGYSFRAIIGAEMIAASSGLGHMILDAQELSKSDRVIAGIIVIGLLGCLIDWFFSYLIKKFSKTGYTYEA
ncbi:ABC transporter permease [Campylobacter volucris]|uniref:ABC transporter permease n=1 Tax=Campylobacter volucris TaxID=1031542 RepID=UPI00189D50CB|nr:ABC transporter permease [Campylobacter volucris]MBF7046578.1 ABC transporter permease [Campylobacter volucris]